jgi:hypothetical protein
MDQLSLAITPEPGIGHNNPPEPIDPVAALKERLASDHADLVTGFHDLELACARVPDPIASEEEAGLATDFIAHASCRSKPPRRRTSARRKSSSLPAGSSMRSLNAAASS